MQCDVYSSNILSKFYCNESLDSVFVNKRIKVVITCSAWFMFLKVTLCVQQSLEHQLQIYSFVCARVRACLMKVGPMLRCNPSSEKPAC